jgi:hypothetical protein
MSEMSVAQYASRFHKLRIERPPEAENRLVAQRGDTAIRLWFNEKGLTSQQITWAHSWMKFSSRQKKNICTGESTVVVRIVTSPLLANAVVLLDGEQAARLSAQGTAELELGLGKHELTIEVFDLINKTRTLVYDTSSPGHDRVVFTDERYGTR